MSEKVWDLSWNLLENTSSPEDADTSSPVEADTSLPEEADLEENGKPSWDSWDPFGKEWFNKTFGDDFPCAERAFFKARRRRNIRSLSLENVLAVRDDSRKNLTRKLMETLEKDEEFKKISRDHLARPRRSVSLDTVCEPKLAASNSKLTRTELKIVKFEDKPLNNNRPHVPLENVQIQRMQPEPFNLTKSERIQEQQFVLNAQPVQKTGHFSQHFSGVVKRPGTPAATPHFRKNYKSPAVTIPIPFSFADRDEMRPKNREQLIKKVMEEEKKAREFHATPVPKALYKNYKTDKSSDNDTASTTSSARICLSRENLFPQFEARKATVLKKSPFIPTKSDRPITEIEPFQLETEIRSKERAEYDRRMKLREEEVERQRQAIKVIEAEKEEEERDRLRKLTVQRATPIRKYRPVKIKPSDKVTYPVSPLKNQKKPGKDEANN